MSAAEASAVFAWEELLLRLLAALLCGGILGFEREARDKPAGLRTHMLVSIGAACFSLVTMSLVRATPEGSGEMLDPIRVVQGVIQGIGFLGAGSIIRNKETVRGLTTAGSIWLAGAVGLAAGLGFYALALLATLLAVLVLAVLGRLSGLLHKGAKKGPEEDHEPPGPPRSPGVEG